MDRYKIDRVEITTKLPSEYQQVEYIEFKSGEDAYIDTNIALGNIWYKPSLLTHSPAYLDFTIQSTRAASGTNIFSHVEDFSSSNTEFIFACYNDHWYFDNHKMVVDDITKKTRHIIDGYDWHVNTYFGECSTATSLLDEYHLLIGGFISISSEGTVTKGRCFVGKVFSFTVYEYQNNIYHVFIPCYRKADGVIGLYDMSVNTFIQNSGTGTLYKGADYIHCSKPNNIKYETNDVRLVKYNNNCVFQKLYNLSVTHSKESSLKTYLSSSSVNSIAYPCSNGCHVTSITDTPSYTVSTGHQNTVRISASATTSSDTSSSSWNITAVNQPVLVEKSATSVTLSNTNSFTVTCYYGTSSGATTYSRSISANSTVTLSNLTTGTTYYIFFRANRIQTTTYSQRQLRIDGGSFAKNPYKDYVISSDLDIDIYGATIEWSAQTATGTIDSSIINVTPAAAAWNTVWTGEVSQNLISTSTKTVDWDSFSGLFAGLPVRITCSLKNKTPLHTVSSDSLPYTVTNSGVQQTVTISALSVTAADTLTWTRKSSKLTTNNFYVFKIEQYY